MVKYNFAEMKTYDAKMVILNGLCVILQELNITEDICANTPFADIKLLRSVKSLDTLSVFVDVCILYSRYYSKFDPILNKVIEKTLGDYCDY